jgi:hypothetical protein
MVSVCLSSKALDLLNKIIKKQSNEIYRLREIERLAMAVDWDEIITNLAEAANYRVQTKRTDYSTMNNVQGKVSILRDSLKAKGRKLI